MQDSTVFVGLDYHDRSVQVCGMDLWARPLVNRSRANDWWEIAAAVGEGVPVQAAIEACTGAADLAEELADQAGWTVHLAHPKYVARLKQSPDKSDYSDAKLLADLNRVGYLPRVWLAPRQVRELRRMVNYRQGLANQRRAEKLRIGALLREHRVGPGPAKRWSKTWIEWVEQLELPEGTRWILDRHFEELDHLVARLEAAEARLKKITAGDELTGRLLSEPQVGLITATALRAAIGRFDRFRSGKQLSRFCGLSPRNASSGQRQADAGLVPEANKQLRATLIELAWRLINFVPRWKKMAQGLRQRGRPGSVVAAAIANRYVRGLYHRMQPASH